MPAPARARSPCRQCGTPNPPERFFCRHCGVSITGAVDVATTPPPRRLPWWKRIFRRAKARSGSTGCDGDGVPRAEPGAWRDVGAHAAVPIGRDHGRARRCARLPRSVARHGDGQGSPAAGRRRALLGLRRRARRGRRPCPPTRRTLPAAFELQGPENVVDRFANTAWATRWIATGDGFEEPPPDGDCQADPVDRCRPRVRVRRGPGHQADPHPRRPHRGRRGTHVVRPAAGARGPARRRPVPVRARRRRRRARRHRASTATTSIGWRSPSSASTRPSRRARSSRSPSSSSRSEPPAAAQFGGNCTGSQAGRPLLAQNAWRAVSSVKLLAKMTRSVLPSVGRRVPSRT